MKYANRITALMLALLLLLSLAACASESAESAEPNPAPAADVPVTNAPAEEPAVEPADEPAVKDTNESGEQMASNTEADNLTGVFAGSDEAKDASEYSRGGLVMPLSEETVEFDAFMINIVSSYVDDMNDIVGYQALEELTNVHINWFPESFMTAREKFNLSIASGDYHDLYSTISVAGNGTWWVGGFDKYIEDDVLIDLADLIPTYAPNYNALANANDTARRVTRTDTGAIPYMRTINVNLSLEPTWSGYVVRQDVLKQTGIDYSTVNTIDEYHDMLVALQAYSPNPLLIPASGFDDYTLSAWNLNSAYFQKDGTVVYGPAAPEFKEYLKTMAQWYSEGLINKDFTNSDSSARNQMVYYGDALVFSGSYSCFVEYPRLTTVEGYELAPLYMPVLEEDQVRHVNIGVIPSTFVGGANWTISTACENPEIAVSWIDYLYSEEGFYLGNYGIQGVTWDWHEGFDRPTFTDFVEDNPDGKTNSEMRFTYSIHNFHAKLYDWRCGYFRMYGPDAMKVSTEIWDHNFDNSWSMPEISMTVDESEAYAPAYNDVNSYVNEMVLKFITGVADVDAEWDTYIKTIEEFGLQDMLDAQQAALDRYYLK